jgi:hypothetical protein
VVTLWGNGLGPTEDLDNPVPLDDNDGLDPIEDFATNFGFLAETAFGLGAVKYGDSSFTKPLVVDLDYSVSERPNLQVCFAMSLLPCLN